MLVSSIVCHALPRKRINENGVGGFNSRAKMGFMVFQWPSLGVSNGPLNVLSDRL